MKSLVQIVVITVFFGFIVFPIQAAYTSLYVFGDALSATADGTSSPLYYPGRDSNGRAWVEVLAQRQGLAYDPNKNNSYYDHNSAELALEAVNFKAPADVSTALFIVWVGNADTFDAAQVPDNSLQWTLANTQAQANHLLIITSLYAKGVRNLIMPNVVDISKIPAFNQDSAAGVMQNGCIAYNAALASTINQARILYPDLKIYTPDFFTLLNNVLTNSAYYGLTNPLVSGQSIDALDAVNYGFPTAAINGYGTNFVFWDPQDPTAKLHEVMADVVQQLISPVQIGKFTLLSGSNRLDVVNYPAGLNGFVDGGTNLPLANWTSVTNITSTNTAQSFFVITPPLPDGFGLGGPTNGSGGSIDPTNPGTNTVSNTNSYFNVAAQFYRLRFPYSWTWP